MAVVKVTDSLLECHELEPSATEDLPCTESRCTLNLSRLKRPCVGMVWKNEFGIVNQKATDLSGLSFEKDAGQARRQQKRKIIFGGNKEVGWE
ncbi:hypothetical protein TNCV_4146591 [Trichonephila clavipes]|nr:hypothetical protein TNCV_4146591 [Trichonephila clavipes]